MTPTSSLHQEAMAAQARAARFGQSDTAQVLGGIAAMIAALKAEAGGKVAGRAPSAQASPDWA